MTTLTCAEVERDIPALALDALDDDERTRVLGHLDRCPHCQATLAQYHDISNQLLVAVPQYAPPPSLKASLLRRVEPAQERWDRRLTHWLRGSRALPRWSVLAACATALVIVSLFAFETLRLAGQQAALSARLEQQQQALALLAGDTTTVVSMTGTPAAAGASATMRYDPQGALAVVLVKNLPALPGDKAYQLWLIDSSGRHDSGAVFNAPAGSNGTLTLVINAPRPMRDYVGCGVSIEPAGGSRAPTGPAVLKGELWS